MQALKPERGYPPPHTHTHTTWSCRERGSFQSVHAVLPGGKATSHHGGRSQDSPVKATRNCLSGSSQFSVRACHRGASTRCSGRRRPAALTTPSGLRGGHPANAQLWGLAITPGDAAPGRKGDQAGACTPARWLAPGWKELRGSPGPCLVATFSRPDREPFAKNPGLPPTDAAPRTSVLCQYPNTYNLRVARVCLRKQKAPVCPRLTLARHRSLSPALCSSVCFPLYLHLA